MTARDKAAVLKARTIARHLLRSFDIEYNLPELGPYAPAVTVGVLAEHIVPYLIAKKP